MYQSPMGRPSQNAQDYYHQQMMMAERNRERRGLARRGMGIGLAILGSTVVAYISADLVSFLLSALGYFDRGQAAEFSYLSPDIYFIQYAVRYLLMMVLPFVVLALCFRLHLRDIFYFEAVSRQKLGLCVLIGVGASMMVNMLVSSFQRALSIFHIEPDLSQLPFSAEPVSMFLYAVVIAVLPALAEEFAYRGVVMALLRPFGNGIAVVGSAFAFGMMHGNIVQIPFAFVCGLVFGFLVIKTKSMWVGVGIHFFNNLISVLQQIVQETGSVTAYTIFVYASFLITAVGAILGVIFLLKRDRYFFSMERGGQGILSVKQQFQKIVGNVGMIICLCYIGIEVLLQLRFV